jgi:hypothetical protein
MNRWKAMATLALAGTLGLSAGTEPSADCIGNCAGWEAVGEYNGTANDLPKTVPEGIKSRQALAQHTPSWVEDFAWTDDNAWEREFMDPSNGGTDSSWVDDVDLTLFAGHGTQDGVWFGVNQDDRLFRWSDAELGNKDLEWLILDACLVLSDNAGKWNRWGWPVFDGLHYVFSYDTITKDVDTRGRDFVKYAGKYDWRVRDAWIKATILSENDTRAASMRADNGESNTFDDHLWGHGYVSPDPDNPTTLYYLSWSTD